MTPYRTVLLPLPDGSRMAVRVAAAGDRVRVVGRGRGSGEVGTVVRTKPDPWRVGHTLAEVALPGGARCWKGPHLLRVVDPVPDGGFL